MNTPLLSVVVPTKDRYKYLQSLISFFEELASPQIELVIQDNTEDNVDIVKFLFQIKNSQIRYNHFREPLTISENSDLAIQNSSGKYVLYLGDDDGVLPNILDAVKLMECYEVDALTTLRPNFMWNDVKGSIHWDSMFPHIFPKGDSTYKYVNTEDELNRLLSKGMQGLGIMPRVYHGIVSRKALDKVWEKFATFFPGPSPDMANAVALSLLGIKTLYVDYPFIIAGIGNSRIKGNEKGDRQKNIKSLNFLDPKIEEEWECKIPKIWTVNTIYPQTAISVIRKFGKEKFLKQMNYHILYYDFARAHKEDRLMLLKLMNFKELVVFVSKVFNNKIIKKIIGRKNIEIENSPHMIYNVEFTDINDYIKLVYEYVGKFYNNNEL